MRAAETADAVQQGPLLGVRVLELGVLLAGPFAGRLLADLGAEVIKVEPPDRPTRCATWGGHARGPRALVAGASRNKRCVTLDLRASEGQALLRALVPSATSLLENFRPGTLERWDLGYEALREVNPRLVHRARLRATARPARTPSAGLRVGRRGDGRPALHQRLARPAAAARSASRSATRSPAMFAVQGVLAALYHRDAQAAAAARSSTSRSSSRASR